MEKFLKNLFDYQRFEHNAAIDAMVGEAEERFGRALSDEELFFVNAAGNFDSPAVPEEPGKGKEKQADPLTPVPSGK